MSGDAAWAGDGADRTAAGRAPVNFLISYHKNIGPKTISPLEDYIFSLFLHYANIYSSRTISSFFKPPFAFILPF
jgi:hypothetical protein